MIWKRSGRNLLSKPRHLFLLLCQQRTVVFGLSFMCAIFVSSETFASDIFDDAEWTLRKDKYGIQVYTARIPGHKHRAVFSTVKISTKVESVVALLQDSPNCRDWAKMCEESRIVERLSETESIVYGLNDAPFPLRHRDSYSSCVWSIDAQRVVTLNCTALNDARYPVNAGVVRLDSALVRWRIVPLKDGSVIIECYAHVDPNGVIPAWLVNAFIVDTPLSSLRKVRKILESSKYDDHTVNFLNSISDQQSEKQTENYQ